MSPDERIKRLVPARCATADELHHWIRVCTGLVVPRISICPGHDAPFEYVWRAYHEPAKDLIVWAPRGGGKTRLAAVLTLLDLLHKPGCAVGILGGSFEQSLRMWDQLLPDIECLGAEMLSRKGKFSRRLRLNNKSEAVVLTQSPRAVRGLRVQKLRCDEVEMFKPEIWEAAQLVTRSLRHVRGTIEAISTHHRPGGLMGRIIQRAPQDGTTVLKWCILEVLERCDPSRDCATCPLWDDCRGIAKERCAGFFSIDDAIAMKKRVSRETWDSEMLCRRPTTSGCVFPSFSAEVHVRSTIGASDSSAELCLGIDFGFADPLVCLWVRSFDDGVAFVIDEYVQEQQTIDEHIRMIKSRGHGPVSRACCDPAGAGRNQHTAASNVQMLRVAGLRPKYRASRIVDGVEMIRAALRPAHGPVRLFVHPRCARLILALQSYHYSSGGGEVPVKDGVHDHLVDALRYFFVNRTGSSASDRKY